MLVSDLFIIFDVKILHLKSTAIITLGKALSFGLYLFIGLPHYSFSQQDPVYTQYMNNLLTIQPAYAGNNGALNITGISRAQWIGFDGAPNTNTLTINGALRRYGGFWGHG